MIMWLTPDYHFEVARLNRIVFELREICNWRYEIEVSVQLSESNRYTMMRRLFRARGLSAQCQRHRILLRQIEPHILPRRALLRRHIHQRHQVQPAELPR